MQRSEPWKAAGSASGAGSGGVEGGAGSGQGKQKTLGTFERPFVDEPNLYRMDHGEPFVEL